MGSAVDRQLIEACMRNERRAQQRMYELVYARLMNVCLRYTRNEEEARGYFVNGFLKVLDNLSRFAHEGTFESWAARVMINSIVDELRKTKRYRQLQQPTAADKLEHRNGFAYNTFELKMNADELMTRIRKLPDATRDVFLLFAVDGYAHAEIAAMLGISEGTSKWHVSDARRRLMIMLTESHNEVNVHGTR